MTPPYFLSDIAYFEFKYFSVKKLDEVILPGLRINATAEDFHDTVSPFYKEVYNLDITVDKIQLDINGTTTTNYSDTFVIMFIVKSAYQIDFVTDFESWVTITPYNTFSHLLLWANPY